MRILLLSSWFPCTPDNGSRIRAHNLLRHMAARHDVSLVSFVRNGEGRHASDLRNLCVTLETVPWIEYSPRRLRALLGFVSVVPRSVVDTYSPPMAQLVSRRLDSDHFDLVVALEIPAARYVPLNSRLPMIADEVQVGVYRDAVAMPQLPWWRLRAWLTWTKMRLYLAQLLRRFNACTVASDAERANLHVAAPAYDRVHVIPNGVDVDHYRPGDSPAIAGTLVYNGALTYSANYDAMRYFLGDILPRVQQSVAGTRLTVTGSTEGVDLQNLPSRNGVTFSGYVDDIRPLVTSSWACVVPLRIGGGTRLKILEAMALGTPVVATSKGAEGLDVTPEQDILIADGPGEFAAQTVRLLQDPQLHCRLSENGRRLVEEKYSWAEIGRRFNDLLESVVRERGRG